MKKDELVVANERVREQVIMLTEKKGMKMGFIASGSEISITTFSKWINKHFNFKDEKLGKVKSFINNIR